MNSDLTLANLPNRLRRFPKIETLEENESFCAFLQGLLDEQCACMLWPHSDHSLSHSAVVIPNLSLGLTLASPHLPPDQLDAFMRRMLVSRISRRVLAEHHIALSDTIPGRNHVTGGEEGHVGIIYTGLNVAKSVRRCTALLHQLTHCADDPLSSDNEIRWPGVIIEGHTHAQFAYIKEHLESAPLSSLRSPTDIGLGT